MIRRSLSACLGAAALMGMLGLPAHVTAKPPDLPENETITLTPKAVPSPEYVPLGYDRDFDIIGVPIPVQKPELTPTLYQLPPTARRTLVGSVLFGINPVLGLLPIEKVLDAPHDHPQRVADDGMFVDMPKLEVWYMSPGDYDRHEEIDWFNWLMARWTIRYAVPAQEQNDGYVHDIALGVAIDMPVEEIDAPNDHPQGVGEEDVFGDMPTYEVADGFAQGPELVTHKELDWLKWRAMQQGVPAPEQNEGYIHEVAFGDAIAYLMPEDSPAQETDAPLAPDIETLPMPHEDAATDGITCPYLRQQMIDRHACQFADPQIGRDVLDNLERLKQADDLIEIAEQFACDGCITEAMECCILAEELCPGSPSADRAAAVAFDLCFGFAKPPMAAEEAAEEEPDTPCPKHSSAKQTIEKKLNRSVTVNFNNTPLREIIEFIRADSGINIYVDEPALAEKGINLDTPITVKLEDLALKSALNLILHGVHLVYVVKDEVLHITTEEHAHPNKLEQRIYAVADLLEHKSWPKSSGIDPCKGASREDCLIDVITRTVSPHSWSAVGGYGTIDCFPETQSLIVNQTPDAQDQIADLLAALRRLYDKESKEKEKSHPKKKAEASRTEPGVAEEVGGLMKACRLLMNEGLHEQAAELARQAYALDPERVMADPLIYKMHLLADTPVKPSSGSSEDCEPSSCPYCPSIGKPIPGIVPQKKESKSGPTTLLVPPLPAVDYQVVPVLDRVLTESAKKTEPAGAEETSEEEAPSSLQELIETIMEGSGVDADGGLRLSGEWSCGGNVYHLRYNRGCLAIWKTSDAAKVKP